MWAQIGHVKIWETKTQKLLGVETDRTLNFDEHVSSLCKKQEENFLFYSGCQVI